MKDKRHYCPLGDIGSEYKLNIEDIERVLTDNDLLESDKRTPSLKALDEGIAIRFESKGKSRHRWHKEETDQIIEGSDLSFLLQRWAKKAKRVHSKAEKMDDGSNQGFKMSCWMWEEFEKKIPIKIKEEVLAAHRGEKILPLLEKNVKQSPSLDHICSKCGGHAIVKEVYREAGLMNPKNILPTEKALNEGYASYYIELGVQFVLWYEEKFDSLPLKIKPMIEHEFLQELKQYFTAFSKYGNILVKVDDEVILIFNTKKKHYSFKKGSRSTERIPYENYSMNLILDVSDRILNHYKRSWPLF